MPTRLAKACPMLGCAAVAPCPIHGRTAAREAMRGSAAIRGYDHRWRAFSIRYFGELTDLRVPRAGLCGCRHPSAPETEDSVCARERRPRLATLIDHIVPIHGRDDARLYDVTNLQGLCDACHNAKRQREGQRAIRRG